MKAEQKLSSHNLFEVMSLHAFFDWQNWKYILLIGEMARVENVSSKFAGAFR